MSDQFQTETALVLFSGGQDSTTCLAWALQRFDRVETLGFDYGQRHRIELEGRAGLRAGLQRIDQAWAQRLGEAHTIALGALGQISDTALTRESAIEMGAGGLPNTFVPGRNIIFLAFAAALAYRRGLRHGGMCETDCSGYPGMDRRFVLHTPLMWIDKAATWRLARELGGAALVDLIRDETHSCYLGERGMRHEWGRGCGECPACNLRAAGWARYRQEG